MGRSKGKKPSSPNEEEMILKEIEKSPSPLENLSYEVRSCADLYRMYKDNQLQIQPDFQRNFVWKPAVQTCFIDSLMMGLPIPTIFMALDTNTGKRVVIDGLQRISTIVKFYEKDKWRLNKLPDIDQRISGKSIALIKQKYPFLYHKIENAIIPVTIIKTDFSIKNSMDNLFNIFHRLNTGGQKLNNQEIRNCIYSGKFNTLLKKVAKSDVWVNLMGEASSIDRLDNEEILLRAFVFTDKLDEYTGNLGKFLNHYMMEMKNITDDDLGEKERIIFSALSFISENIDSSASIYALGKTLKEALLVGVCKNIDTLVSSDREDFLIMFEEFISDDEFQEENLKHGLSKKDKVQSRLNKAISIFK